MEPEELLAEIEAARKELLDLGLRNPLINYRPLRAKGVETTGSNPARVFDVLVRRGRTVSFVAQPDEDEPAPQSLPGFNAPHWPDGDVLRDPTRNSPTNRLQTPYSSGELDNRLLKTYYESNTRMQETGVNSLFLALGMIRWYESDASDEERRAPLVLVPVKLDRAGVQSNFRIEYTGEDIGTNVPLIEKLRIEFGINFPHVNDDEEDDREIDLNVYFSKAELSIKDMVRWFIDSSSVALGFFSYNKFLMYQDLDVKTWPEGSGLLENKLLNSLFGDGFNDPGPAIDDEAHLDEHVRPQDVHHVIDADSSQVRAILDVNKGRHLVIQGPPGTGKSQTITNIIAEAISNGEKVLFVSEKMAALDVVKRRLDQLELGDACLELHSHKTAKRTVLEELKRTLSLGKPNAEGIEDDFTALARVQSSLNEYADAVNNPVGTTGIDPIRAYGELLRIRNNAGESASSLAHLEIDGIDSWPRSEYAEKRDVVEALQNGLRQVGPLKNHIFWGSQLRDVMAYGVDSLRDKILSAQQSLGALDDALTVLTDALRLNAPKDVTHTNITLSTAKHHS